MTDAEKVVLDNLNDCIKQSKIIQQFKGTAGWSVVEKVLKQIRRESLEALLAGRKGESRDELIGYAKCINYILNFLQMLVEEGTLSESTRKQMLSQIRETEELESQQDDIARYTGQGGIV